MQRENSEGLKIKLFFKKEPLLTVTLEFASDVVSNWKPHSQQIQYTSYQYSKFHQQTLNAPSQAIHTLLIN